MIPEGLMGLKKTEEWHELRRRGIGSSDWSHVLSPADPKEYKYWCQRQLWYEKNAVPHDFPESFSRAAARGSFLEDKVIEMFVVNTGFKRVGGVFKRVEYAAPGILLPEWMSHGQPDLKGKMPETPDRIDPGEVKCMGDFMHQHYLDNGPTIGHTVQCMNHIARTGADLCWFVVGYFGNYLDHQVAPIARDNEMIAGMVNAGRVFWDEIRTASDPPPRLELTPERCGGCPFRRTCLGVGYYEEHVYKILDISDDDEIYRLLLERDRISSDMSGLKNEKDVINKKIKIMLSVNHNDIEEGFCREYKISHKKGLKRNFDKDSLMADDPETYRKYLNLTPSRTFAPKVTKKSRENWEHKQEQREIQE